MDLEKRVSKLETILFSLINKIEKREFYNQADKSGFKQQFRVTDENIINIEAIAEEALCDIDKAYDQRVSDVEEALCEISEMMEE